jgi:hypothetical protein
MKPGTISTQTSNSAFITLNHYQKRFETEDAQKLTSTQFDDGTRSRRRYIFFGEGSTISRILKCMLVDNPREKFTDKRLQNIFKVMVWDTILKKSKFPPTFYRNECQNHSRLLLRACFGESLVRSCQKLVWKRPFWFSENSVPSHKANQFS